MATTHSDDAIGIISNHGDDYFSHHMLDWLSAQRVRRFVYIGPVARVRPWDDLVSAVESLPMTWVYGREDPGGPRVQGQGAGGLLEYRAHGVLFRYFAVPPNGAGVEGTGEASLWYSLGTDLVLASVAEPVTDGIIVVGSRLGFEHWVYSPRDRRIRRKSSPQVSEMSEGQIIPLDPAEGRHIIVHPGMRCHYCSVIDPTRHRMILGRC